MPLAAGAHQVRQPKSENGGNPLATISHNILVKATGQRRCCVQFSITMVEHNLSKSPKDPWLHFPGAISSMFWENLVCSWLYKHPAEEQMVWSFRTMDIDGLRQIRPFGSIHLMRNEALSWCQPFLRWHRQEQIWRWVTEMMRSKGT